MRGFSVILLITALSGIGYWYWTTTPEYSLIKLHDAIKNHDVVVFDKYVDVENVSANIVDAVIAKPVESLSGGGILGKIVGFGLEALLRPAAVEAMKSEVNELVETGGQKDDAQPPTSMRINPPAARSNIITVAFDDSPAPRTISLKRLLKHFGFRGKVFDGIKYDRRSDKDAEVGLNLRNQKYAQDLVLVVHMHDMGGYWRVIELTNLPELMHTLVELEIHYKENKQAALPVKRTLVMA